MLEILGQPNVLDILGEDPPLILAVQKTRKKDIVQLLIENNADVNIHWWTEYTIQAIFCKTF